MPDVRRRFDDDDPDGKAVAQVLERAISYSSDQHGLHATVKAAVMDMNLPGRGVTRIRYEPVVSQVPQTDPTGQPVMDDKQQPVMTDQIDYQKCYADHVQWDDFRRGPGKKWADVPWVAFRHAMTREQLTALNPELGPKIKLDANVDGYNDQKSEAPKDLFKRAVVWEIHDKESGQQIFIAESYKDAPLSAEEPVLKFEGFFPCPEPLYARKRTTTLVPLVPYEMYRDQAEELNIISRRLKALIKVCKWRGIADPAISDALKAVSKLNDGDIEPATNAFEMLAKQGGLDKAIWLMPIDKLVGVIQALTERFEQVKQEIYEITGIADILRGSSNPNETLGAQQLKAQWGSLRISDMQEEVQRYARDLFRMMAEVYAENFEPQILQMMTGIALTPQQVALMRNDVVRTYRIDIETDSTIRADLNRAQQNITGFVQGFGQFVTAVGPAVQAGVMPMNVVVDMLTSFARVFKLGRQVEDSLDGMKTQAEAQAQQPQQQKPDPEMLKLQQEQQIASQKIQAEEDTKIAIAKMDNETKLAIAAMQEKSAMKQAALASTTDEAGGIKVDAEGNTTQQPGLADLMTTVIQSLQQTLGGLAQSHHAMASALNAPKRAVRDAQGRLVGSEPVPPQVH